MEKHESEGNTQPPPTATMPPPSGPPHGMPPGSQRADSISMYTNFNAPRLSTDTSLSSFLNIAESQHQLPHGAQPPPHNQQAHQQQQAAQQQQQQQQQLPHQQQQQQQSGRVQDLGPYSRGYSIINNFWATPQAQPGLPGVGPGTAGIPDAGQFTTMRRQSEQLEPFMPRFKTPSFSSGRSGSNQLQQPIPPPGGARGDTLSSSKRGSIFYSGTDAPDLDFLNPSGKRDSTVMMRPPHVLPQRGNSASNIASLPGPMINPVSQSGTGAAQEPDLDALFAQGLSSRKNSMKFSADDFDFQLKRRNSSVRGTLENASNYLPMLKHAADSMKKDSGSVSPIHRQEDDVEARIHKHLTPVLQEAGRESADGTSSLKHDAKKRRKNPISKAEGELKQEAMKDMVGLFESKDPILIADDGRPLLGATKVDQLMLVIQARKKGVTDRVLRGADGSLLLDSAPSIIPPASELVGGVEKPKARGAKQHECPYCHKCFTQSTHLEVHVRSHIGYKPFQCDYCGKRFTQGGNLRTHVRLHTGEKPYECDKCGRRFSRKGNLAAHKLTHENLKPFHCKLDGCNKSFTQLGNMKAHQNRFHLQTLNELTQRLAEMDANEKIPPEERELLDYFADIYKNSNRGIRGRGKGNTRIATGEPALMKSSQNSPSTPGLPVGPPSHEAALVAAKALNPAKNLGNGSHSDHLSYNLCTPTNDGSGSNASEAASDPTVASAHVPDTNEFTFPLDQNNNPAFHNTSHNPNDLPFKNVSYPQ